MATIVRNLFAVLAILGVASAASALAASYTILELGTLGDATAFSSAAGINEAGQVTGSAGTAQQGINQHAYLWQPTSGMQDLGTLGGTSRGEDINEAGQVVGYDTSNHPFLWDAANGMQNLGTGLYSFASGINDAGFVVGHSGAAPAHAFLWHAGNGMQDLGTFGGNGSRAAAINNAGQVVGTAVTHVGGFRFSGINESHGFVWDSASNTTTVLTPLPSHTDTHAVDINEAGQVVGTSGTIITILGAGWTYFQYVPDEAFVWQDGVMTGLGKLPGATISVASAINNVGQVVGSGGGLFLWEDGVLTDLNSLIDPSLGWSLGSATDINDQGQIVGSGYHNGVSRAFLLSPITAPPTLPGDYDGDGDVDGGDFLSWQQDLGSSVAPSGSGADGDHSGVVDAGDLTDWQDNFGSAPGSGSMAVGNASYIPEPATSLLLGVGLAGVGICRLYRPRRRGPWGAMIRTTVLRSLLAVLAILGVASAAPAAVLFSETFSYPDGHLASAPPDGGVSGGLWTAIPQSFAVFPRVHLSNGKITVHQNPGLGSTSGPRGEDVQRGFSALAAGQTIYAGFDVSASYSGYYGYYQVASFVKLGLNSLAINPLSGSDFTFRIGTANWASGLAFNTTYRVVMSYDFDTGCRKLWVNPVNQSSTNISATGSASYPISTFALWQDLSQIPNTQVLDNLVVGTSFDDVLTIPGPALPGDFNGDNDVDGFDFLKWQRGESPNTLSSADLADWESNYGTDPSPLASATNSVPEPATFALAAVGLAVVGELSFRRGRRSVIRGNQAAMLAVLAVLGMPSAAPAAPLLSIAYPDPTFGRTDMSSPDGPLSGGSGGTDSVPAIDGGGGGSFHNSGTVDYKLLRAVATVAASQPGDAPTHYYVSTYFEAKVEDEFIIDAPGLAGTVGMLDGDLITSGAILSSGANASTQAYYVFRLELVSHGAAGDPLDGWGGRAAVSAQPSSGYSSPGEDFELSPAMAFVFGEPISIEMELRVSAYAGAANPSFRRGDSWNGAATADLTHTIEWMGLSSVRNAAGNEVGNYVATGLSGTDWSTAAVPEPASRVLLAFAVLVLAVGAARNRRLLLSCRAKRAMAVTNGGRCRRGAVSGRWRPLVCRASTTALGLVALGVFASPASAIRNGVPELGGLYGGVGMFLPTPSHPRGSGAMVSQFVVLTAAQNFPDRSQVPPPVYEFTLGPGITARATEVRVHPDFETVDGINLAGDIALVALDRDEVRNWPGVNRSAIRESLTPVSALGTGIGFGDLYTSLGSGVRRSGSFSVTGYFDGADQFGNPIPNAFIEVTPGNELNQMFCLGDQGGPLFFEDRIAGVASFRFVATCEEVGPGYYVSLHRLTDWIRENLNEMDPVLADFQEDGDVDGFDLKV